MAYSYVGIPANNIHNNPNIQIYADYYFANIYSVIEAEDKPQATEYQTKISADPETGSEFRNALKTILNATYFDMSPITSDSLVYLSLHSINFIN